MLAEDEAKWQVPGSMHMLPVDVATVVDKDVGELHSHLPATRFQSVPNHLLVKLVSRGETLIAR